MKFEKIKVGMESAIQKEITREDTALNFGSGALETLLASPTLVALMIEAAVSAVDPNLPDEYITVGKMLEINHVNPTIEGMTVTVKAKIVEVADTKVVFEINAFDELGLVGTGKHIRNIVQHKTVLRKANDRCKAVENQDR